MKSQCPFEQDLLDAVAARRWPERADPALRAHVDGCAVCADVAIVAMAFVEDADAGAAQPRLPAASAVWWRSQVRARGESARAAARPIAIVQGVATAVVAAVSIAVAPSASAWVRQAISGLGATGEWPQAPVTLSWILGAAAYASLPVLVAGLGIVLAPVVVYLALDE